MTSFEPINTPIEVTIDFDQSPECQDLYVRSHSIEQEELEARARLEKAQADIDIISKKKQQHLQAFEARRQALAEVARKNRLAEEQRRQRQESFLANIDSQVLADLRDVATGNFPLRSALELITGDKAHDEHFELLKNNLIDQLVGDRRHQLKSLAGKILNNEHNNLQDTVRRAAATEDTSEVHTEPASRVSSVVNDGAAHEADRLDAPHATTNKITQAQEPEETGIEVSESDSGAGSSAKEHSADLPKDASSFKGYTTSPLVKLEYEAPDETSDSSPKRRKLHNIEDTQNSPQSPLSIESPTLDQAPASSSRTSTGDTPTTQSSSSEEDDGAPQLVVPNQPELPSSNKRARNRLSTDSMASIASSIKQTPTRISPAMRAFERKLGTFAVGTPGIDAELICQKCKKPPSNPRLTTCAHLYCNKCIVKLRNTGAVADIAPTCVAPTCQREVMKKCSIVSKQQVEQWKVKYTGGEETDVDMDSNDED